MNATMFFHLMRKDLRLVAFPWACYFVSGLAAVALLGMQSKPAFYAGTVILITALCVLAVHPTITTVVNERKDGTLAFVMSLPISPRDYVISKLAFNLLAFFVPWSVLLLATCMLFSAQEAVPDGLIPFVTILFSAIGTNAVLILCVAIVTESMDKTIATMAVGNLAFHGVFYASANADGIKGALHGQVAVWSASVMIYLGAFLTLILASLALALWRHSRKTDFL
jgi:ABC-2 type transport system permease protein